MSLPPGQVAELDVCFANQLARLESFNKHLYRPNTYLHKWWARRCGTTFRAILKHLVPNPDQRDYYTPGGLEGQIILDPMLGGGTTLHEAIRLGANVIGADIDAIPVLQARATLTSTPLPELQAAFTLLHQRLNARLRDFYQTACPDCGQIGPLRFLLYGVRRHGVGGEALVVDSYVLRRNRDGSEVTICPDTYAIRRDRHIISHNPHPYPLPLLEKTPDHSDGVGGSQLRDDLNLPYYRRYAPLAVVGECPVHGLFFAAPQVADLEASRRADRQRAKLRFDAADFAIAPGPKSLDLQKRGIHTYLDLFSSRQLLYLQACVDELARLDVSPAIRLKLALLISTAVEFNSMLCGYKGAAANRPGAIRHTFAHHAYAFPYTALENNPLYPAPASGTLTNLFRQRLVRGQKWAQRPVERWLENGRVSQVPIQGEWDFGEEVNSFSALQWDTHRYLLLHGSSVHLPIPDDSVDHVVTDPPYFDSVQYSDLAAFFRVWLKQLLPTDGGWAYALTEAAVDQEANGNGQYEAVLGGIFKECHRVLKKDSGRLIFTFHHWNPKGWAELTLALKRAGFVLVNYYVIHAENPSSVHIVNQKAMVHDVVLILAASQPGRERVWDLPGGVSSWDSLAFCQQCGRIAGYVLSASLSDQEIRRVWSRLLEL